MTQAAKGPCIILLEFAQHHAEVLLKAQPIRIRCVFVSVAPISYEVEETCCLLLCFHAQIVIVLKVSGICVSKQSELCTRNRSRHSDGSTVGMAFSELCPSELL